MQRNLPGFSLTELLIVIMIAATLGTVGLLTYEGKVENIRHATFDRVKLSIAELVTREYDRIIAGKASTLIDPTTNRYVTSASTCRAFLRALRPILADYKNPYDKSPAVTFSSAGPLDHKRGKVRITCYKLLHHGNINGADCPLSAAAIRVTEFNVPCGAHCHSPLCPTNRSACRGRYPHTWYAGMQKETFIGKLNVKKVHIPPHYYPDTNSAAQECKLPYFFAESLPLEPNY